MSNGFRNARDAESRSLPQLLVIDFGYRNVELVPDVAGNGAQNLSLVLKRRTGGEEELEPSQADEHRCKARVLPLDLLRLEGLDDVPLLDVLKAFESDPAFKAGRNLALVILESSQ